MMKQQVAFAWEGEKYYRCRPALYEAMVAGEELVDIDGTRLFFYRLEGMAFQDSIEVLTKEEQFCAKVRAANVNFLAVFGMYRVVSVSLREKKVIDTVEIPTMIEKVEASNGYAAVLTSDEEGENKLVYCWKLDAEGRFKERYEPVEVHLPEYEECDDSLLELAIIQSIELTPKVYLYWRGSNQMLEVDPLRRLEERYNRIKELSFVVDIDAETYSEIAGSRIVLCSKKGGKELGTFTNEQEQFKRVIARTGEHTDYFSISNRGVKRWQLDANSVPVYYANSDEYPVETLYLTSGGSVVGINLEKRWVLVWRSEEEATIHSFPNEVIKKVIRMSESLACLMLEATISKQAENEYQVEKHNKMEVYDFAQDKEVAKKAVLKLEYRIDVDSAIVAADNSVLFILNEECEAELKKHIFRWWPFAEDKKKEIKKREILGGSKFDSIKLLPFDRILTLRLPQASDMYDLFGKAPDAKCQVSLFDFSAKKIGDYELSGDVLKVELSSRNQLFALGRDKFSVYEINSSSKNRLEKSYELDISVTFVHPFADLLLMKKKGAFLLYDRDFELLMKEDEADDRDDYRLLRVNDHRFVLVSAEEVSEWDLEKEEKTRLAVGRCEPNLVELMGGRLVVADKWIKAYDFQSLRK